MANVAIHSMLPTKVSLCRKSIRAVQLGETVVWRYVFIAHPHTLRHITCHNIKWIIQNGMELISTFFIASSFNVFFLFSLNPPAHTHTLRSVCVYSKWMAPHCWALHIRKRLTRCAPLAMKFKWSSARATTSPVWFIRLERPVAWARASTIRRVVLVHEHRKRAPISAKASPA